MRITVSCPATMIDDANALAMVLAFNPADGRTYGSLNWKDSEGNLYAAASFVASAEWITRARSSLDRPQWDVEPYIINMEAANRAQAALVLWSQSVSSEDVLSTPPQSNTSSLTAIGGMDGLSALNLMGLSAVEIDDEMV